jgi:UDPglucose 6-dehydrogenase
LLGTLASRRVGVLGLAFKARTGDVRESQSIALVEQLLSAGASVCVHDPLAMDSARVRLGDRVAYAPLDDHLAVGEGADAIVLATDWDTYRDVDFSRLGTMMRERLVVDPRNLYDPAQVTRAGFRYAGMGRPIQPPGDPVARPLSESGSGIA